MRGREDPLQASDRWVGGGGKIVGLIPTHVDDLLLVADDTTRELVGQGLDNRFDSLRRRSPRSGIPACLFRRIRGVFTSIRAVTFAAWALRITARIRRETPRRARALWVAFDAGLAN